MIHSPEHLSSLVVDLAEEQVERDVGDPYRFGKLFFLAAVVSVADCLEVAPLGMDHVDPLDLGKHGRYLTARTEKLGHARDGRRGALA